MKLAIATEGKAVSQHFGSCENFTIVQIENGMVEGTEMINTSGHLHGSLPPFLASQGINVVISGGMGPGAKQGLAAREIEVLTGIRGTVDEVIAGFIQGTLVSTGAGCSGHDHSHGHSHEHHHGSGCNCGNH